MALAKAAAAINPWDVRISFAFSVLTREGQLFEHKGTTDLAALLHPRMLPEGLRHFQAAWKAIERPVIVMMDGVIGDLLHQHRARNESPENIDTHANAPALLPPSL